MHARYYSGAAGRFLSVDPLEGDPSDPQSWNRYAYVRNNPIDRTDPDGREDKKWNVQQIINEASEYVEGIENGYVSSVAFEIGHHAPSSDANALGQAVGSTMALVQSVDEAGTGAAVAAAGGMVTVLTSGFSSPVSAPAVVVGGVAVVHGTISAGVSIVNIASAMSSLSGGSGGGKKAGDLISGSLKKSKSYRSELESKTKGEIDKLAKQKGPLQQAAKQMKKLIDQAERLRDKIRN